MPLARLAALGLLLLAACSSTSSEVRRPRPSRTHSQGWEPDWREMDTYGLSPENPIQIGGGPEGQEVFLSTLRGPQGESLAWRRLGSCCVFETPNGIDGHGLLDMYEVLYEGQERSVILYLDMYDSGPVAAPTGFTLPEEGSAPVESPAPEEPRKKPKVIEL